MSARTLQIKWQRLLNNDETCPRCGSTGEEIDRAVKTLRQSLTPLGIEVLLEKEALTVSEFKRDPLQSNRIWINDRPLEECIQAQVGQSACCDVCGPSDCRTIETGGREYETIPADMIIQAGLLVASQMTRKGGRKSNCCGTG